MTEKLKKLFAEDEVERQLRFLATKLHYRLGDRESIEFIKMVDDIKKAYARQRAPKKARR